MNSLFRQQCYLLGEWRSAPQTMTITNPFSDEVIGTVPNMGEKETQEVIAGADKAFQQFKALTAQERANLLHRWHQLILEYSDELAHIMTLEQGKPLAEAKGEVLYAASFIEWFAEEARRTYGTLVPSHKANAKILVTKEPIGVVAAITPWNFPAAMITRKCGPAFAAGCPVILKPAPDTPFTALALAVLAEKAGFPAGVFNVITGDAVAIGGELTSNKRVRKLSFTGSTPVGKLLMRQSADNIKKLSLELGGNAPFIVFEDADLDAAVEGTMIAKFRNAGQTCVCANRLYVQRSVYTAFCQKLVAKVSALNVGNGFDQGVHIGPLINDAAVAKVVQHVEDAQSKGAQIECGQLPTAGSRLVQPLVLSGVTDEMLVAQEETFGPMAPLFVFDSEEEVLARANNTDFGLAAYFYTQSLSRAWRVSEALEAGIVGVNEGLISTTVAPFGGVKESGLGREGSFLGMDDYMESKYILMGL
ncbi:TPA: succinate-semialdehyde dehydrogenase [Vibrio vulnificus]|uniref:NAD-dependent succinate-semialdehyde dehydrogenase n=1 Tax=Vibrio vulnificus TaxID=672 RepID=UPI001A33B4C6|nr:NAD-dependent succinate-semialdehyde dehydrogenase [Vibrio vulnificus]MCU8314913.1 NAD-dependent succinate-semialdehyde dehydrogenase [Vibrio vulnificus]HAS6184308.1 succinate-semialdehyde dehydrogenase [Vibrio vulnificus]HAS6219597.1 succinate-semialdehyde dehydrogenase [Vibrio vulnificus]HAS6238711.1 succinate-semialdehyde dehydrogenase [Vibrio vulnificus]